MFGYIGDHELILLEAICYKKVWKIISKHLQSIRFHEDHVAISLLVWLTFNTVPLPSLVLQQKSCFPLCSRQYDVVQSKSCAHVQLVSACLLLHCHVMQTSLGTLRRSLLEAISHSTLSQLTKIIKIHVSPRGVACDWNLVVALAEKFLLLHQLSVPN